MGAHIHVGTSTQNGPVLLTLLNSSISASSNRISTTGTITSSDISGNFTGKPIMPHVGMAVGSYYATCWYGCGFLVVENSPLGIEAAYKAGIPYILTLNNTPLEMSDFGSLLEGELNNRIFKDTNAARGFLKDWCCK
jgi:hypothetical protein